MATIDTKPGAIPEAPAGHVLFVADVPLNLSVQFAGRGGFDIVGDKRAGLALQPGTPFACPAHLADLFESVYGGGQDANAGVSPIARGEGRIPGLQRIG